MKDITFWKKLNQVETHLAKQQGKERGFFTYTELMNLAKTIELQVLIQCIIAMVAILTMTYTLGVLSIAGSFHAVRFINGDVINKVEAVSTVAEMENLDIPCVNHTEIYLSNLDSKNVEPAQVLRTSLFLASINTFMIPFCNSSCSCSDNVHIDETIEKPWEWWNIPSMKWLTENSQDLYNMADMNYLYKYFIKYLELLFISYHDLEVGNHVNMKKSTKTRIQDQMESSWHKEWMDSLKNQFSYRHYFPNHKL